MTQIHQGDALTILRTLPEESVQCCVTSPPYWGLRDYGTAAWDGGDAECDHLQPSGIRQDGGREQVDSFHGSSRSNLGDKPFRDICGKCGATRVDSQLGLEPTPEEYVANMVEVFREVRRVLHGDGTLWLNLGDSYAANGISGLGTTEGHGAFRGGAQTDSRHRARTVPPGLKPKDLVGIPWRVAFALQADGWYLRSDIIWAKPNPMPESVTDRPTKAHEYLFLLSKSARYFYDADAIREPNVSPEQAAHNERYAKPYAAFDDRALETGQPGNENNRGIHGRPGPGGRNKRSVWTIATQPYPEAHFATFPEALVEPCVEAGSRVGDVVLDPFAGSGTTLAVAKRLDREGIGIELNPAYVKLAEKRIRYATHQPGLFAA